MGAPTRNLILRTLRGRGKCTIKELADTVGVSPVSVRHHLASLQADNLVAAEEIRHGVGRPRLVFSLTEDGLELLPSRYFHLTSRLLEEIKGSLPEGTINELLSAVASSMAQDCADQLRGLPFEQRLSRLVDYLTAEGFEAELEEHGDQLLIHELGCPYYRMGREHPEVCLVDQAFIATALSLPVERVTCLLDGHTHCTFAVRREDLLLEASPNG